MSTDLGLNRVCLFHILAPQGGGRVGRSVWWVSGWVEIKAGEHVRGLSSRILFEHYISSPLPQRENYHLAEPTPTPLSTFLTYTSPYKGSRFKESFWWIETADSCFYTFILFRRYLAVFQLVVKLHNLVLSCFLQAQLACRDFVFSSTKMVMWLLDRKFWTDSLEFEMHLIRILETSCFLSGWFQIKHYAASKFD